MIALQIRHIKDFMNKLLIQDTFDRFLVSEASVTTRPTDTVHAEIYPDIYAPEEAQDRNSYE